MLTPQDRARQLCLPVFHGSVDRAYDLAAGSAVLTRFVETAPATLHCTDDFEFGLRVRSKGYAFTKRSIQVNTPWECRYIVIDRDAEYDIALPVQPSIAILNERNGHSHLLYELVNPVLLGDKVRDKPQRFLDSVRHRLTAGCGGDTAYAGHITKNPLHPDWRVVRTGRAYTLDYLSRAVREIPVTRKSRSEVQVSHSRNCTLFDTVRVWAYGHVNDHAGIDAWRAAVLVQASQVNQMLTSMGFAEPLPQREVASVARSISKWTWGNRSRLDRHYQRRGVLNLDPSLPLKERQRLAAEHANRLRRAVTEARLWDVVSKAQADRVRLSVTLLAREVGIQRSALYAHYGDLLAELFGPPKVSTTVSIR